MVHFVCTAGENLTSDTLELVLLAIHDPGIESGDKGDFEQNFTFILEPLWKGGMQAHIEVVIGVPYPVWLLLYWTHISATVLLATEGSQLVVGIVCNLNVGCPPLIEAFSHL